MRGLHHRLEAQDGSTALLPGVEFSAKKWLL